jgi:hypothetical protein
MTKTRTPSTKTKVALKALSEKKLDAFAWIAIVIFALELAAFVVTFIGAATGKTSWPVFLELNGAALSMLGALWTALGVRMSSKEKVALLGIKNNAAVVLEEIVHTLSAASHFATFGAYFILVGGALLCIKAWFFH